MAARRGWDDPWKTYAPSVPLPTTDGIATSKQRGEMASTWWSHRLVGLLATYGLGARMDRGRRYARQGQLLSFDVQPGLVVAQVQGSRRTPYVVTVACPVLDDRQWEQVEAELRSVVAFTARLLAGEVPPELEDVFTRAGVALLPTAWGGLRATCSCPDWENPCKHVAAVLFVFADRLDDDPWLLLRWRGRERDDLLAHLRGAASATGTVTPWWPLTPGAPLPQHVGAALPTATSADPAGVLTRLGPLDVTIRSQPAADLLAALYRAVADAE